jgi:hypothetical protein
MVGLRIVDGGPRRRPRAITFVERAGLYKKAIRTVSRKRRGFCGRTTAWVGRTTPADDRWSTRRGTRCVSDARA